jgi:hypothetical protein
MKKKISKTLKNGRFRDLYETVVLKSFSGKKSLKQIFYKKRSQQTKFIT